MKLTRSSYTIALDAHYDLVMAGMPCEDSDVEAFETEYRDAAAELAEELSIDIYIVNIAGCGYESDRAAKADQDEEATKLWQLIHNRV